MLLTRKLSLSVVISSSLLAACEFHGRRDIHQEELQIRQAPETVVIDVGSGDLSLFGADVSEVSVTAKVQGPANHVGFDVAAGRVTLFDDCQEEPCSVDFSVVLPAEAAVNLRTGSGDIRLENMHADVVLRTGSGDIAGWQQGGLDFSAETGSGDVAFHVSPQEIGRAHV